MIPVHRVYPSLTVPLLYINSHELSEVATDWGSHPETPWRGLICTGWCSVFSENVAWDKESEAGYPEIEAPKISGHVWKILVNIIIPSKN